VHADEDKKLRDAIEAKNEADSLIYSLEKLVKDNEGKIEESEKQAIESEIANLRKAMEGGDADAIRAAKSKLEQASHKFAERIYRDTAQQQQQQPDGGPQQGAGAQSSARQDDGSADRKSDDNVVDADYEVVDDDKK
jgi:molecular chaperone DnaK